MPSKITKAPRRRLSIWKPGPDYQRSLPMYPELVRVNPARSLEGLLDRFFMLLLLLPRKTWVDRRRVCSRSRSSFRLQRTASRLSIASTSDMPGRWRGDGSHPNRTMVWSGWDHPLATFLPSMGGRLPPFQTLSESLSMVYPS